MLKLADDYVGYRIASCILFGILTILTAASFIQCFIMKRKGKKNVQLILMGIAFGNSFFYTISQGFLIKADYALQRGDTADNFYWNIKHTEVHIPGYCFQNSTIIGLVFMWIELFNSVQYGNFVEQEKSIKKYAKIRISCMIIIWWFTLFFFDVPVWVNASNVGRITYWGFIPVGLFVFVFLIFAVIRWRKLYILMKDCLKQHTRNGDRFIELTKVTLVALYAYFMNFVYGIVLSPHPYAGNLPFHIFTSFLPNLGLPFAVWYYFTPQFRRTKYPNETSIPGVNTTGSTQPSDSPTNSPVVTITTGDMQLTSDTPSDMAISITLKGGVSNDNTENESAEV